MPSPRNCRVCGVELNADVRWCTQCYTPVTEFAARPTRPGGFVDMPRHDVRYTRWQRSPSTFGPLGRLGITAVLLLGVPIAFMPMGSAFWPVGLWFLLGYCLFSSLVLRSVWQRVPITDATESPPHEWRQGHPHLAREVRLPRIVMQAGAVLAAAALVVVIGRTGDDLHRFFAVAGIVMLGFGVGLARWLDLD